jgi:hypothetical protein
MISRMACVAGLIWILWTIPTRGATVYKCDGSQSDCQNKVNGASDGDTVVVPAGSFRWTGPIFLSGKAITFQGQGIGSTIITGAAGKQVFFNQVTTQAKASFRITGMTLKTTGTSGLQINASGGPSNAGLYGFRIDHIDIQGNAGIFIGGIIWGLIDHCTFEGDADMVTVYAYNEADFPLGPNGEGATSYSLPLNLGTKEAVYVEDCTFTETSGALAVNDMQYGARMVFRHNTASTTYIQTHSARGSNRGGGLKWEIYNNTWNGNGRAFRGIMMLSGTGVIFNNTISGYTDSSTGTIWFGDQRATRQLVLAQYWACTGAYAWDGNIESTGWPCLDQIGRGPGTRGNEPTVPVYLWNNGTAPTCAAGGACNNSTGIALNFAPPQPSLGPYIKTTAHSNGDKDYCIGTTMPASCGNHTNTYTPFTYPHPLQSAGGQGPASPTNLTVVVH